MKKIILSIMICLIASVTSATNDKHIAFSMTFGTAIDLSQPSVIPFNWQITGIYKINRNLYAGIGTGVHIYEKTLIPILADAKFILNNKHKLTPFLECSAGYSFAPVNNANGGFYFNPSLGIQYPILKRYKLSFAIGYELQELERIKKQKQELFDSEFMEKLSHNTVSVRLGIIF